MCNINEMVEKTFVSVTGNVNEDEMIFIMSDGTCFMFYHEQDDSENVRIKDITGNLQDLIGVPIVKVEENSQESENNSLGEDSHTWTFYKFATVKGYVTVQWLGESNGYYSESVHFKKFHKRIQ